MARRRRKHRRPNPGLPPGSLDYVGEVRAEAVRIQVIAYGPDQFSEKTVADPREALDATGKSPVTWIHVVGVHDPSVISALGQLFGLHPLVQEDILNTEHSPKLDFYPDHVFFVLKKLNWDEQTSEVRPAHFCVVLGDTYVLSFEESSGGDLEPVRERIRRGRVRMRASGPDYLYYALVDAIVDHYFAVLENVDLLTERLEEEVLESSTQRTIQEIQRLRRSLVAFRRTVWSVRESTRRLARDEHPLVRPETRVFLSDVNDHAVHVLETLEAIRESAGGLLEIYLSTTSNRLNEVMKVLTIIATIFIPLTFIAGIYGMNFEYMPELHQRWGYPAVWALMVLTGLAMLVFFRRKNWL